MPLTAILFPSLIVSIFLTLVTSLIHGNETLDLIGNLAKLSTSVLLLFFVLDMIRYSRWRLKGPTFYKRYIDVADAERGVSAFTFRLEKLTLGSNGETIYAIKMRVHGHVLRQQIQVDGDRFERAIFFNDIIQRHFQVAAINAAEGKLDLELIPKELPHSHRDLDAVSKFFADCSYYEASLYALRKHHQKQKAKS